MFHPYTRENIFHVRTVTSRDNLKFGAGVYEDRKLEERSERKKLNQPELDEPDDPGEIHEDRLRNNGAVNFVAIETETAGSTIVAEIVSVENILTMAIKLLLLTVSFAKR